MLGRLFGTLIAAALVPALVLTGPLPGASADQSTGSLVQDRPAPGTPQILDGRVLSIAKVGDTVILGGSFSTVRDYSATTTVTRTNLLAFDQNTGQISNTFVPSVDGAVNSVIPGANGTVYIGGAFNNVNGAPHQRLAQLNLADGSVVTGFDAHAISGDVKDLRLFNGRLFVAGAFTSIAGSRQLGLATLNPTTGGFDAYLRDTFAGTKNGGYTTVSKFNISATANRLLAIGNFLTVDGAARSQVVMLDLGSTKTALSNWSTTFYTSTCSSSFNSYMRDLDISPDGSYAVISVTGAYSGGPPSACDTTARFETAGQGEQVPSWIDYTGGDTTYAVEITDSVVYTGGHARWQNNPFAGDATGPGAVSRPGIAALDPLNGLPLSWNPTRDRGVGVFDMRADEKGLWVGSDTTHIGPGYNYRARIALMPTGGTTFVNEVAPQLPNDIYSTTPGQGLVRRHSDGATFGAVRDAADPQHSSMSNLRGAFMLSGSLFTGWSDGSFLRQSYDGSTLGTEAPVNGQDQLVPLTAWKSDLGQASAMTYQRGRIYYTLQGQDNLYYRYFTPESNMVGAMRYTASGPVTGLSFSQVTGMVLSGDSLYTTDASGTLSRTDWVQGPGPSGTPTPSTTTPVSGPTQDGQTWAGPLFLYQDSQGLPAPGGPQAGQAHTCQNLTCSFDGSSSTGNQITSYSWAFGDGATAQGVSPTHTYAATGSYQVTLTVTDSSGATSSATKTVQVTAATISYVASAATNANATNHTVKVPSSVQPGDLMLLAATINSAKTTLTPPPGWTQVRAIKQLDTQGVLWSRTATGSDPGSTVSFQTSTVAKSDLTLAAYRSTNGAPQIVDSAIGFDTTSATTHQSPQVNAPSEGTWLVSYFGREAATTTGWSSVAAQTTRISTLGLGAANIASILSDSAGSVPAGPEGRLVGTLAESSANVISWSVLLGTG
ncbi:MAG: PKD domain-containing protein [Actinomycetota bacterium]|nr:PKD domain-containing protein [Actinomycetota bacterium]